MRSGRDAERRWWIAAAATLAAIYASLSWMQALLDALRERNLLRKSIVAAAALAAAGVVGWLARRRAGWREWLVLAVIAALYAVVASRFDVVQERIHLLQYGLVALLFLGALEARASGGAGAFLDATATAFRPAAGAVLLTAAAGWLDEGIQGVLPNRHYDLRDVGLNALAGAMAVGALAGLRRARAAGASAETA
jgi:CDP-diglyceride synthetase